MWVFGNSCQHIPLQHCDDIFVDKFLHDAKSMLIKRFDDCPSAIEWCNIEWFREFQQTSLRITRANLASKRLRRERGLLVCGSEPWVKCFASLAILFITWKIFHKGSNCSNTCHALPTCISAPTKTKSSNYTRVPRDTHRVAEYSRQFLKHPVGDSCAVVMCVSLIPRMLPPKARTNLEFFDTNKIMIVYIHMLFEETFCLFAPFTAVFI